MSSSSSLSSARRRRVGAQQTVQNPPSSVRDVRGARLQHEQAKTMQQQQRMQPPMQQQSIQQQPMQQQSMQQQRMSSHPNMQQQANMQSSSAQGRGSNIASSMSIPPNTTETNGRPVVNPAQLLLQHDYRLFQIEKLVKSIHENTSKEELGQESKDPNAKPKVNMEEIKGAVSESIYESEKLKKFVQEEVRNTIEASYDFDSFYENLQKVSNENSALKDTIMSNQKYINEMNSVLLKLLTEFRELHSIVRTIKPSILETIDEAEELIDEHKKESEDNDANNDADNDEENNEDDEDNDDEPEEEAEEEN